MWNTKFTFPLADSHYTAYIYVNVGTDANKLIDKFIPRLLKTSVRNEKLHSQRAETKDTRQYEW